MTHPAHEPTDHRFVEHALLRHEADATPNVQPGRPLHQGEVQIAEMGHCDDRAAGVGQVLGPGGGALDAPEAEERPTCHDGCCVDGFASTGHGETSLLRGAGRRRSASGAGATGTVAAPALRACAIVGSRAVRALAALRAWRLGGTAAGSAALATL